MIPFSSRSIKITVWRLTDNSILKQILFVELLKGRRPQGMLKQRYKGICKSYMRDFFFPQSQGQRRTGWRLSHMENEFASWYSIIWGGNEDQNWRQKLQTYGDYTLQHMCCCCAVMQIQNWWSQLWGQLFNRMRLGASCNSWHLPVSKLSFGTKSAIFIVLKKKKSK